MAAALTTRTRDAFELEQLLDFARGRKFCRTLLCRQTVQLDRTLRSERLLGLYAGSRAEPVSAQPDLHGPTVERFRASTDATADIAEPIGKAALLVLIERRPELLPFDELLRAAWARLGRNGDATTLAADAAALAQVLLEVHQTSSRLVSLHSYAPPVTATPGERPLASPVARLQARTSEVVTNLYHQGVELIPFRRCLLLLLDGSRDRAALVEDLLDLVGQGVLVMHDEGQRVDVDTVRQTLDQELEGNLHALARLSLLIA